MNAVMIDCEFELSIVAHDAHLIEKAL